MTELLCLNDSYIREFSAKITAIEGKAISPDKTAFYPQGGGQPADKGGIFCNGKEFQVLSVKKSGQNVMHELDSVDGLKVGGEVQGKLDWDRRYRLMRFHTSAHILAAVIFRETGKLITGNQLDETYSRMDFNVEEYSQEFLKGIEEKANAEIAKNHEISISVMPREEALKVPELVRLKDIMPPAISMWRIVKIGNLDIQADGGTHVKNTSEIGKIRITKTENKGKSNRRIYWELS